MKAILNMIKKQNQWLIAIVGFFIFAPLSTFVIDLIKNKSISHTLFTAVTSSIKFLGNIFNKDLKLWVVIVFIIITLLIIKTLGLIKRNINSKIESNKDVPEFLKYNSDTFPGNLVWTWEYQYNSYTGQYSIINLNPLCMKCNTPLLLSNYMRRLEAHCPRCKASYFSNTFYSQNNYSLDTHNEVRAIITDNIHRSIKREINEENN